MDPMSLQPVVADFIGFDQILQGTDWSRTIVFSSDMSAYDPATQPGAVLRGALKTADLVNTLASTEAGTMVLSWDDAFTLRVEFTAASTAGSAYAGRTLYWDCEAVNGLTSKVDRIAQGKAFVYREVTTSST